MLSVYTFFFFFFFNDTATTEIYTLSLHDALPICVLPAVQARDEPGALHHAQQQGDDVDAHQRHQPAVGSEQGRVVHRPPARSEEHTSELQSRLHLVCRLLLEKKKKKTTCTNPRRV